MTESGLNTGAIWDIRTYKKKKKKKEFINPTVETFTKLQQQMRYKKTIPGKKIKNYIEICLKKATYLH